MSKYLDELRSGSRKITGTPYYAFKERGGAMYTLLEPDRETILGSVWKQWPGPGRLWGGYRLRRHGHPTEECWTLAEAVERAVQLKAEEHGVEE